MDTAPVPQAGQDTTAGKCVTSATGGQAVLRDVTVKMEMVVATLLLASATVRLDTLGNSAMKSVLLGHLVLVVDIDASVTTTPSVIM